MAKARWTEEEKAFLVNNYKMMDYKDIAQSLGRSVGSIQHKLSELRLNLPPEELSRRRAENAASMPHPTGEQNPNWRGGISKNHYHYKKLQTERYPERINARRKVAYAIQYGHLKRLPCEVCGSEKVQAHHDDYSKPLDVRWLCKRHHDALHQVIGKGVG